MALDEARREVIALAVRRSASGRLLSDLVAGDVEGKAPPRELVAGPDLVTGARLSPRGDRIAYSVLADSVTLASTLYVSDYPMDSRRLTITETMADNAFAWGPDGRLWLVDRADDTMHVASFSSEPVLQLASIDAAFSLPASMSPQRGFAIAPDGRLLMVRSLDQTTGSRSGRLHVIVGWAEGRGAEAGP